MLFLAQPSLPIGTQHEGVDKPIYRSVKQIADLFGKYITITCHNWLPLFNIAKSYETVYKVKNIRLITDYAESPGGRLGYDRKTNTAIFVKGNASIALKHSHHGRYIFDDSYH